MCSREECALLGNVTINPRTKAKNLVKMQREVLKSFSVREGPLPQKQTDDLWFDETKTELFGHNDVIFGSKEKYASLKKNKKHPN